MEDKNRKFIEELYEAMSHPESHEYNAQHMFDELEMIHKMLTEFLIK